MGSDKEKAMYKLIWSRLFEISRRAKWDGQRVTADDWRLIFSHANGFGGSIPRHPDKQKVLLDSITAFGNEQDVKFTAPEWMREAAR